MKKILSILFILLLFGCTSKPVTPTNEVEDLFYKYNSLDKVVIDQLEEAINAEDLTNEQKDKYKEIFKRQYKDLKYTIKDEVIDDNISTVTVEIEVYDLNKTKTITDAFLEENPKEFEDDGVFNQNKYIDYKLNEMQATKERIKYTLELTLTNIEGTWKIDNLVDSERQKIHGTYEE
jgi:hypothetical protein